MHDDVELAAAARLFKVLGNESRLRLLQLLEVRAMKVGELTARTTMSQPLVSQHLRTLWQEGLVSSERRGKEVIYSLADEHVADICRQALVHVKEPISPSRALRRE